MIPLIAKAIMDIAEPLEEKEENNVDSCKNNFKTYTQSIIEAIDKGFYDSCSIFGQKAFEALKAHKLANTTHIDSPSPALSNFYKSKSACKDARDKALKTAYTKASNLFEANSSSSIAQDAAKIYSNHLQTALFPMIDDLKNIAEERNKLTFFRTIEEMVINAKSNLLEEFIKELRDNQDYYNMYDISYFMELTDIEVHDFRVNETGFFGLLESIVSENIEYTVTGYFEALSEMQNDLDIRADSFYSSAHTAYRIYAKDIVRKINILTE